MKRWIVGLALVLMCGLLASGCPFTGSESTFTISVTGTVGAQFSGSYMVTSSGGSESKSVDGTIPASYTVTGTIVSVTFQKQAEDISILKVEIKKGNIVVKSSETTAAYGVVSVATC